jgi:hypothetical protein
VGTSSFLERKLGKELYVAERGAEPPLRPVGTGNFVSAIFSFPASSFLKESWAKNFTSRNAARSRRCARWPPVILCPRFLAFLHPLAEKA